MSDDLRERVARAIANVREGGWPADTYALLQQHYLTMADAALAEIGAVRVKPLVWWEPSRDNNWTQGARTFFCTYYVGICGGRHNAWTEIFHEGQGIEQWDGPTRGRLAEAKADAQADYEARILAAIEPAPVSVREAARVLLDHFVQIDAVGVAQGKLALTAITGDPVEGDALACIRYALRAIAEGKDDD